MIELRQILQKLIDEKEAQIKQEKYWYPLNMPTFDVEEIISAVDSMCSFRTTMSDKTKNFENAFSEMFDHNESVMVNSGSSADLLIAFVLTNPMAKLLNRGDEILVPSVTWPTQVWSSMMAGLKVKMVDTNPDTLNMDIKDLESKISSDTKAISLVHLMGNPCDMDSIMPLCKKHNLILIEDCCESMGAKYNDKSVGTFGLAGSYSFFFSHHITTMEGGMIGCQDQSISDLFRLFRSHGWARNVKYMQVEPKEGIDQRYMFLNWGFNVRPTELQAGFGLVQLGRHPAFHGQRRKNVFHFQSFIQEFGDFLKLMEVSNKAECSWFALPIMLTDECPFSKADLLQYLESQGIETRPIVAGNLALQPVCKLFPELQDDNLPGANKVHNRGFYIGLYPFDSFGLINRLCDTIYSFLKRYK